MTLATRTVLENSELSEAVAASEWLETFTADNLPDGHPFWFEAALLAAEVLALEDPASASRKLAGLDLDLFNWTRRQTLSGSYDTSVASRALADDLLLFMARHAVETQDFAPHFAEAIHRWKTLESPTDRKMDQVVQSATDPELREAARSYRLAAARFRERVRAEPITDAISTLDAQLAEQREALNLRLGAAGLPLAQRPLAPITDADRPVFSVEAGDVVIDLILLRDWTGPDRSSWSQRLVLYAAVHRNGIAPEIHEITTLDFDAAPAEDVFAGLWGDVGAWAFARAEGAERVFLVPDALLFRMDLLDVRDVEGRRLGAVHDVFLLSERSAYARHDVEATLDPGDHSLLAGGLYYDARRERAPGFLPGSLREIQRIGSLLEGFGATYDSLQKFDATEERVRAGAAQADILHLSTHGFFREIESAPFSLMNAGILLSSTDLGVGGIVADDNTAFALEVLDWDLRGVELVVLSACNSGAGYDTPIDAVRGLPLALSRAGARR
ncbi:MAG: CHAT domain-containing protein, partial [Pseudomonadota bacterium]